MGCRGGVDLLRQRILSCPIPGIEPRIFVLPADGAVSAEIARSPFSSSFLPTKPNTVMYSGVPRNFVRGGGSTNSVEDRGQRERGSGGGSPLVSGSGGSCNLAQEISFHIVKFS